MWRLPTLQYESLQQLIPNVTTTKTALLSKGTYGFGHILLFASFIYYGYIFLSVLLGRVDGTDMEMALALGKKRKISI